MKTLMQRSQVLDAKLRSLTLAKKHADDHLLIQQRTQEWSDQNQRFKVLMSRTACLTLAPEDAKVLSLKRSGLRQNAGTILARLQQNDDIKELTRDAAWKRLLKSSEGLSEDLEAAGQKAWRTYKEEQGALENPDSLRLRTPSMPQNDNALQAYLASYTVFQAIARLSLPRTADDLSQLANHVASCRQAFSLITFDLPVEVKCFYEAINAGTATLAEVTPSVLKWLADHGHLERFRVRSAGQ